MEFLLDELGVEASILFHKLLNKDLLIVFILGFEGMLLYLEHLLLLAGSTIRLALEWLFHLLNWLLNESLSRASLSLSWNLDHWLLFKLFFRIALLVKGF